MSRTLSRVLPIAGLIAAIAPSVGAQAPPPALQPPPVAAEPEGVSPTVFWLAASATIITASLGGFYALHVQDLYDEADLHVPVSPERSRIRAEMERSEVTADVLLWSSLAMAIGTTILTFYVAWDEGDRPPPEATVRAPPRRAWW